MQSPIFQETVLRDYPSYAATMMKTFTSFKDRLNSTKSHKTVSDLYRIKVIGALANLHEFSSDKSIQHLTD